ncbi:DNA polymerase 1, putative [Plasmodium ovale]|nr:DNA polymerase 1, putative [Plasmodium ovale]
MKSLALRIKPRTFRTVSLNVQDDMYICKMRRKYYNSVNYKHLTSMIREKKDISKEVNLLYTFLHDLKTHKKEGIMTCLNKNRTHTSYTDECCILLKKWKASIKIFISWFPEINEDKYKSKCFSLPTNLTFHVVVPHYDVTLKDTLQKYEFCNFYKFLHHSREKRENSNDKQGEDPLEKGGIQYEHAPNCANELPCGNPNEVDAVSSSAAAAASATATATGDPCRTNPSEETGAGKKKKKKGDTKDSYVIEYSIKRDTNMAYINEGDILHCNENDKEKILKGGGYNHAQRQLNTGVGEKDSVFFFSFNMHDLRNCESAKETLSLCMQGERSKNPHEGEDPFLFVVYDYKTLIHIFKYAKLDLPKISNVFDVHIVSSLLQLVQRGEKLQNVFNAYLNERDIWRSSQKEAHKEAHKEPPGKGEVQAQDKCFSHFGTLPPEFADVLSGKFGLYGWGKYQRKKEKGKMEKVQPREEDKAGVVNECHAEKSVEKTVEVAAEDGIVHVESSCKEMDKEGEKSLKKKRSSRVMQNHFSFTQIDIKHLSTIKKMVFGNKRTMHEITQEDMVSYCIARNVSLIVLFNFLESRLEENLHLLNLYVKIEQPLILCISEIERRGIFLNRDKIEDIQKSTNDPQMYKQEIEKLCNCTINLNSSKQVSSLLYSMVSDLVKGEEDKESCGYDIPSANSSSTVAMSNNARTINAVDTNTSSMHYVNTTINEMRRNRGFQTNSKMLKIILDEIENKGYIREEEKEKIKKIINNIKLYRESKKLFQNYIENLPKYIQKDTNKIHCNFNQVGASTGRLSCDQPNLQNIHARFRCAISSKEGETITGGTIAGETIAGETIAGETIAGETIAGETIAGETISMGRKKLITFDYKQMELFVMAYLSFDTQLLRLLTYSDVFVETAKVLFNTNDVSTELRRMTKTVIYGILYGQSENGLAKSLLISDVLAKNLIDNFFNYFPNVFRFMQMQKLLVKYMNCVYTLVGRKRIILPTVKNKYRISMNTPIQGCAADIMKFSLLSCFSILSYHMYKNIELLKINKVDNLSILENKKFLKTTKLILQVHDELLLECEEKYSEQIIHLLKPVLENAFYNLIQYTNTNERLLLLYNYMHDQISIQTYIQNLQIMNNHHCDANGHGEGDKYYNSRSKMDPIFQKFSFRLPTKAETGGYYKECS